MDIECPMSKERRLSMECESRAENDTDGYDDNTETCPMADNNDQNCHNISEDLRQFDVLDEVQGDDTGSENDNDGKRISKIHFIPNVLCFQSTFVLFLHLRQTTIQVTLKRPTSISMICWTKGYQMI